MQFTHSLKAPGFNPCAYEVISWFQAFAFKFKLYRYTVAASRGPDLGYLTETTAAAAAAARAAQGLLSNNGNNITKVVAIMVEDPTAAQLPAAAAPTERPTGEEVAAARSALDANLRAARSSPAVMGLERMGAPAAETGGWSADQSAAFEEHMRAHKLNLFAVSRMGSKIIIKKPPSTSAAAAVAGAAAATVTADNKPSASGSGGDASGSGDDEEQHEQDKADERLAGKSLHDMVGLYKLNAVDP
jgi:hypothetical protein